MNPFGNSGWEKLLPYLGILPALLLYVVFGVGPSAVTALFSFTNITGTPGVPWHFVGLKNYMDLYHTATNPYNQQGIGVVLLHTIVFALVVTVVQNAIALGIALILNMKLRGHVTFRAIIFLPAILGVTVVGLVWTLIFNPLDGPAERIVNLFGGQSAFLGSNSLAFPLVIGIQIWMALGWSVLIWLAGLQTIPNELYEAGKMDGVTRWQSFRYITYPMLAASVSVNILLAIIGSLQTFDIIYVLTDGQFNTMTLGMLMFNTGFGSSSGQAKEGYGAAISMLMFVCVLIVTLGTQVYLRKRESKLL